MKPISFQYISKLIKLKLYFWKPMKPISCGEHQTYCKIKTYMKRVFFQGHLCRPHYLADKIVSCVCILGYYINAGPRRGKAKRNKTPTQTKQKQTGSGQRKGEKGSEQRKRGETNTHSQTKQKQRKGEITLISFSPLHLLPWILISRRENVSTLKREPVSAEQLQAWRWACPESRRYSCSPSSPGRPPTPTPTTVRDSCSPCALIFPEPKTYVCSV